MPKMTKTQTDYALLRLTEHYRRQRDDILDAVGTPAVILTPEEKWRYIRRGEAVPYSLAAPASHKRWAEVFDWSPFERAQHVSSSGQQRLDALQEAYKRAKDEIMLGDSQEALELLRQFAQET